jgi:hypothetical protein
LGEKKQRKNAQTDGDAQQQKAPIHSDCAPPSLNIKLNMHGAVNLHDA